jgi:hypothetical protein
MPYSDQVDAEPARQHVKALLAGGMTISQIQFASGVNRTAIRVMLGDFPNRPASAQIRQGTATKLLRTRLNRGASIDGLVPAAGTHRRLQALQAIGYTGRYLLELLGYPGSVRGLQFGRNGLVRAEIAQRVMALYDELHDKPGPSSRVRELACLRGWLPPVWWDDDIIDDPEAEPEGVRVYDQRGRLIDVITEPRPVRVARMSRLGLTADEIAQRIGTRAKYVYRDRSERPVAVIDQTREAPGTAELDEVAIHRIMAGTLRIAPHAQSPERTEAIRRMAGAGLDDGKIGDRLGVTKDAVLKIRIRNGIAPALTRYGRTA